MSARSHPVITAQTPTLPAPPLPTPPSIGDQSAKLVEENKGKGSYLMVPPRVYLQTSTSLFGNSGGSSINRYTLLLDIKTDLSKLENPVSLFEASWPDLAGSETENGLVLVLPHIVCLRSLCCFAHISPRPHQLLPHARRPCGLKPQA